MEQTLRRDRSSRLATIAVVASASASATAAVVFAVGGYWSGIEGRVVGAHSGCCCRLSGRAGVAWLKVGT